MFEGLDWETLKNWQPSPRTAALVGIALVAYTVWWYRNEYKDAHEVPKPVPSVSQSLRFLLDKLGH